MFERQMEIYTVKIGEKFLTHEQNSISPKYHTKEKAILHRLDDFCAGRSFRKVSNHITPQCPPCFQQYFELYTEDLKIRGRRCSTIKKYRNLCITSLLSFHKSGMSTISDITSQHILIAFNTVNDKPGFVTAMRGFLKLIYKKGFHEKIFLSFCRQSQNRC